MIVTGTQRSGTASYASLLGIAHEYYFNPCNSLLKGNEECKKYGLNRTFPNKPFSESSWLAAPHIKNLPNVIRLVRHPMSVINSIMGINFWEHEDHTLYREYISRYIDLDCEQPASDIVYQRHLSAQYYIKWHNLIPDTVPVVRIEDLINGPHLNSRPKAEYTIDDLNINDIEQLEELIKPWSYTMDIKELV